MENVLTKGFNKIIKQFRKSIKVKPEIIFANPKFEFLNGIDSFTIKVLIPEEWVNKVKVNSNHGYISVSVNKYSKKIFLNDKIDMSGMKTLYSNGVYSIVIPKIAETPEERLNRLAWVIGA